MRAVRAVKILKKAALKKEEIERFIHEIEILKTLVSLATFKFCFYRIIQIFYVYSNFTKIKNVIT